MKNNIKYKYIFIYCTGIASLATINILKKIKLTPHRIIEDNLEIVHKKFYGIKISSLDQINQDFNIKTLNKSLFLVSPFMLLSSNLAFLVTFEVNPPA